MTTNPSRRRFVTTTAGALAGLSHLGFLRELPSISAEDAAKIPTAAYGTIEVRPLMEIPGAEG